GAAGAGQDRPELGDDLAILWLDGLRFAQVINRAVPVLFLALDHAQVEVQHRFLGIKGQGFLVQRHGAGIIAVFGVEAGKLEEGVLVARINLQGLLIRLAGLIVQQLLLLRRQLRVFGVALGGNAEYYQRLRLGGFLGIAPVGLGFLNGLVFRDG